MPHVLVFSFTSAVLFCSLRQLAVNQDVTHSLVSKERTEECTVMMPNVACTEMAVHSPDPFQLPGEQERQRVSELEGRIDDRKNGNKQMQGMAGFSGSFEHTHYKHSFTTLLVCGGAP
jgi:hypothetical protein